MRRQHLMARFARLTMAGAVLLAPAAAFAQAMTYSVMLSGDNQVPPVATAGTGVAEIAFDPATSSVTWTVSYEGLSGPPTAAHFHGPAAPGENAGVVVPFDHTQTPIAGSATLTAEQAAQLTGGLWYVNIHTAENRGGEIRGWVSAN